jgi:hypothetical protein
MASILYVPTNSIATGSHPCEPRNPLEVPAKRTATLRYAFFRDQANWQGKGPALGDQASIQVQ